MDRRFTKENQSLIIALVAKQFLCEPQTLFERCRSARVSNARHVAMSLMRILLDCTLTEIAVLFGRDHTTVIHAKRKVDTDKKLQQIALEIAKKYKAETEKDME
ncbi:MAG: helix-turn-helix domain-containing protein [Bacteroidota bacterium]|jgi:chromosomal replication initiation ATPase DnaA